MHGLKIYESSNEKYKFLQKIYKKFGYVLFVTYYTRFYNFILVYKSLRANCSNFEQQMIANVSEAQEVLIFSII